MNAEERRTSRCIKHGDTNLTDFTEGKLSVTIAARAHSQYDPTKSQEQWAASVHQLRAVHPQPEGLKACASRDEYGTIFRTAAARRG